MGEARIREAQESLLTALSLDPLHPAILTNMSVQVCQFGLDASAEKFQRALAMNPEEKTVREVVCLFIEGKLAASLQPAGNNPSPKISGFLTGTRAAIGDCEAEWLLTRQIDADRFFRSLFCSDGERAETLYASLPEANQGDAIVLELYALLRLKQEDYQGFLDFFDRAYPDLPVVFELYTQSFNWTSEYLRKAYALEKLGRLEESGLIVETIRMYIDRAKREGAQRGYRFLEGSLTLMEGDPDGGYQLMAQGIADHEVALGYEWDPMLRGKLGPERLAKLLAPLHDHVNAERAKLGWPAIEF
jgi:tetratricopeptide (TPR) repeat protein